MSTPNMPKIVEVLANNLSLTYLSITQLQILMDVATTYDPQPLILPFSFYFLFFVILLFEEVNNK